MNKIIFHDVKDLALSPLGKNRIEWAGNQMPVLKILGERFMKENH